MQGKRSSENQSLEEKQKEIMRRMQRSSEALASLQVRILIFSIEFVQSEQSRDAKMRRELRKLREEDMMQVQQQKRR